MNTQDIETVFIGFIVSIMSLTLFIYLANIVFGFLKISDLQLTSANKRRSNAETAGSVKGRKRIESKPTIICSLPIHQEARKEMPLF